MMLPTKSTKMFIQLKSLGKDYTKSIIITKILCSISLDHKWKVTAVGKAKSFTKMPLNQIMGSLLIYENGLSRGFGVIQKNVPISQNKWS